MEASSTATPEKKAQPPSGASSATSKPDAHDESLGLIIDETEELLAQGITGVGIVGFRQAPGGSEATSALTGLAQTVQTVATPQPSYQGLKTALSAVGVPVP